MIKKAYEVHKPSAALASQDCENSFDKKDQWKCFLSEYRLRFVKTPFVLIAD